MKTGQIITLLTDFGLSDPYVGMMKGVIAGIAPEVPVIDLTHQVRPQDIQEACFLLQNSYRHFPTGTIFVCVVDPGVGTERLPVLVKSSEHFFVGPDNGLFGFLNTDPSKIIRELKNERFFRTPVSHTFHGRDIFAPVAAHLAAEGETILSELGPVRSDLVDIAGRLPDITGDAVKGKIVHIDRFGNLITNIHEKLLSELSFEPDKGIIRFREFSLPLVSTFSEAPEATPCALIGSSSHLEIFIKNGNAEKTLNAQTGETVYVYKHHG